MKKNAFTLAEVLITLMILGIIAALTIPSLIQNSQRKEEVVQIQKGLSVISQAVSTNYALTQEGLNSYDLTSEGDKNVINMLRQRLYVNSYGDDWIRTSDGLTFFIGEAHGSNACTSALPVDENGDKTGTPCFGIIVSTRVSDDIDSYDDAQAKLPSVTNGVLPGYYQFYTSTVGVFPQRATKKILTSSDASKIAVSELSEDDDDNT